MAPWYFALLCGFATLRLVELWFSARHRTHLLAVGGKQVREPLYPVMVGVHAGLFVSCALEVTVCSRPVLPWLAGGMLVVLGFCVAGRVWVWRSLGRQWNVRVVTAPLPVIDTGPYRYVRHPNYTIVIAEMLALPLVHTAYLTALLFSLLNAGVLRRRIRLEEAALRARPEYAARMGMKPRFLPSLTRGR